MNREQILLTLRAHEMELKAAGVLSLSIFGSAARGESSEDSDVDIAVRLAGDFSGPGLDYFSCLDDLEMRLSQILGCNVDVIEEPVRKVRLQKHVDMDRALPSEKPARRLEDIIENAQAIQRYTAGIDFKA